jgi:predicted nucleotidyltransferase
MDLPEGWRQAILAWAEDTKCVREVWLFGSRAKGISAEGSDVDLAIYLMPPSRTSDWALQQYFEF